LKTTEAQNEKLAVTVEALAQQSATLEGVEVNETNRLQRLSTLYEEAKHIEVRCKEANDQLRAVQIQSMLFVL
jgi:hypothetical protein